MQKRSIIGGDFNLYHKNWDCVTANSTPQAKEFSDWVTNSGGKYGLFSCTITHHQGGAIDSMIVSRSLSPQVTECYINTDLDATSDHKVIFMTIKLGNYLPGSNPNGKFQLGKLYKKIFVTTLNA